MWGFLLDIDIRLPKDDLPCKESFLHIDEALVAAASEEQIRVAKLLYEGTVYEYVEQLQQFALCPCDQTFEREARVAPDVLVRLLMDGTSQFCKAIALIHRVATCESDVGKGIGHDNLHQFICRHPPPTIEIP